jgi:CheY-like chemotaxis protein
MFYQVNDGTAPYRGGLGIGLALVKRIVEMHGGTVEVRSPAAGNGSEFVVRLPLVSAAPVVASSPLGRSVGLASPRRVLVVDDNEDSANSLAVLLRRDGNTVRTAYDGLAAIAAAESFHAEVVLLDIGLPALDGYHVARQIRQTPWGRDIVLVAVTGWGQENDRRRTREAGFDAHLVKPVDFGLVRGLLGRAPAPERLGQPVVGP